MTREAFIEIIQITGSIMIGGILLFEIVEAAHSLRFRVYVKYLSLVHRDFGNSTKIILISKLIAKTHFIRSYFLGYRCIFQGISNFGNLLLPSISISFFCGIFIYYLGDHLALSVFVPFVIFYAIVHFWLIFQRRHTNIQIKAQLQIFFDSLIRYLRGGFDFNRSIDIVADEVSDPLKSELVFSLRQFALGQDLGKALSHMAKRIEGRELLFFSSLVSAQQRSGGSPLHSLISLAQILKDQERLQQKRLSASAEARMSAYLLGGLPILISALLLLINPAYRDALFYTEAGRLLVACAIALLIVGTYTMYRMIRIDF